MTMRGFASFGFFPPAHSRGVENTNDDEQMNEFTLDYSMHIRPFTLLLVDMLFMCFSL